MTLVACVSVAIKRAASFHPIAKALVEALDARLG
ncbi:hypothetical protein FHS92_002919 [Sphingobium subterraneum]|uniref:Uncharacterized protein n=1 Tax=Sphingobium subterraneum TaxID=627688 RepID=A0A841J4A1_9SPHN|nr:hypothetical protein [Sphingobium subterraneum]